MAISRSQNDPQRSSYGSTKSTRNAKPAFKNFGEAFNYYKNKTNQKTFTYNNKSYSTVSRDDVEKKRKRKNVGSSSSYRTQPNTTSKRDPKSSRSSYGSETSTRGKKNKISGTSNVVTEKKVKGNPLYRSMGSPSTGEKSKKPLNKGLRALKKKAPQVVKAMGFKKGGRIKK